MREEKESSVWRGCNKRTRGYHDAYCTHTDYCRDAECVAF